MKCTSTFFVFMCLFWVQTRANAQSDSTDLTFEFSEVVYESDSDSIFFPADLYSSLSLAFDISDTTNFGSVYVELTQGAAGGLIFKKTYTLADLTALGFIDAWSVLISFGNVIDEESYAVFITIKDYAGVATADISKTL